jgi:hypothetical protein
MLHFASGWMSVDSAPWARTRKRFALVRVGIDTAVPDSQAQLRLASSHVGLDVNYNNWLRARYAGNCAPLKVP